MIITIFIINHIITITILMSKRHQRIHIACIVGINLHFALEAVLMKSCFAIRSSIKANLKQLS